MTSMTEHWQIWLLGAGAALGILAPIVGFLARGKITQIESDLDRLESLIGTLVEKQEKCRQMHDARWNAEAVRKEDLTRIERRLETFESRQDERNCRLFERIDDLADMMAQIKFRS